MKTGRIVLNHVHSRHLRHAGVAARTARATFSDGKAKWMVVGPLRALGGTPEHAGYELLFYCSQLKDGSISVSYAIPRKDGSYYGARNCPFAGEPGFMNLDSEGYTVAPGMAERILAAMRAGPGAMRSIARGEDPQPCPVTDEQRAEFDDWVRHGYPGEFEDDDG